MNRSTTISLHSGLLILLFLSIADCLFLKDADHSRHRRGFRKNAASRLAHGYGKRGIPQIDNLYDQDDVMLSSSQSRQLSQARDQLMDAIRLEDSSSAILSTEDFSKLLQEKEELAEIIVKKFIDINDDGVVSSDELFRRIRD